MNRVLLFHLLLLLSITTAAQHVSLGVPEVVIEGAGTEITLRDTGHVDGPDTLIVDGHSVPVQFRQGEAVFTHTFHQEEIVVALDDFVLSASVKPVPSWMSIIPPLLAILLALLFREVITALFAGILSGAIILGVYTHGPEGILTGFLAVIDTYLINAVTDADHQAVIIFSMLIGGMVAIISRNGGMAGVVNRISAYAKTPLSGQLATWILGVAIFFDDYANTLVVGNTMRPVTDKLKISREKLSYIVDSTAAPVAAIAFVTTWIGTELSYIKDGIDTIPELNESAYGIFLNSLAYSFYPVFTLIFILFIILKKRDFGPMLKAEVRARTTGIVSADGSGDNKSMAEEVAAFSPVPGIRFRPMNAIIPVVVVVLGTMAGLVYTGIQNSPPLDNLPWLRKLSVVIGNANSYTALLWSSLGAVTVAVLLSVFQRLLKLGETMEAMMKGFKTMLTAVVILILAWSLASVTDDLRTADFITGFLVSIEMNPVLLPMATFILAALVAFSTGSSWSTMAILYPLILPAGWMLCRSSGMSYDDTLMIFHNLASCVLAGAVLGDHSSPISDTTILSSLASSCNHIDHVRTQLPYALTVGSVAIFAGTLPGAMGVSSWITMPAGIVLLFLIVHFFGKRYEQEPTAT